MYKEEILENVVDYTDIAIVGMAGRFPGAKNIDEFWLNLREGVESISWFSEEVLEESGIDRAAIANPNYVKAGAILEDIDLFDAPFFDFSSREAEMTDPQQRLFLECAWEALEAAGYNPDSYEGLIGVYAGASISNYLLANHNLTGMANSLAALEILLGNDKDFLPTKVCYKLNLKGAGINVQTACSTSLVAVHLACQSLLNGENDMALAGGVSVNVPQKAGYLYQPEGILSPDGHCRAFDAKARGTIFGSGAGIVVLKRLEDALADGDCIHAVIKGSAINNDGAWKASYTAPSANGQAEVIAEALANAGLNPEDISYIETHGTGTALGDPIEIAALTKVFRASTDEKGFCGIGSVKTNVGHMNAAAGIASLIKTVLALKHKLLPPNLHFESPNPEIDFENSPFYVNDKLSEWKTNGQARAGVSSFGIGGTNAHLILEEAPLQELFGKSRPYHLLVLSAKTTTALDRATTNLATFLQQHPETNLADVAYTLSLGRKSFKQRRILVCQGASEAATALSNLEAKELVNREADESGSRKIVFMFSGQGSQYVNMGQELYEIEPTFREWIDKCSEILQPHLGLDLRQILYPANSEIKIKASEQLKETAIAQPALFVVEYALAQLWISWGILPTGAIGHSIGEYVAACIAGVFSLEEALALVAMRGKLMQQCEPGAMLAVPLPVQEVEKLLNPKLSLAAINTPSLCAVSGSAEAIEALQAKLASKNIECRRLHTSHGFHSQMMEPILASFLERAQQVKFQSPQMPYISNVTGTWVEADLATDPNYWARHLRETVRFADGIQKLLAEPEQILLEVGPGRTLKTLALQNLDNPSGGLVISSLPHVKDVTSDEAFILNILGQLWTAGVTVDWSAFYKGDRRLRLPLPTYPFDRQRYWLEPAKLGASQTASQTEATKNKNLADWFYLPLWKQSASPELLNRKKNKGSVLVFADEWGLGSQLLKQLQKEGWDAIAVQIGTVFSKQSDRLYALNPKNRSDYETLFTEIASRGLLPETILHLWSITPTEGDSSPEASVLDSNISNGFYSLLFLAQALGKHNFANQKEIIAVSNNGFDVTGREEINPAKTTILGAIKVIPQEYAHISCRYVDVEISQANTNSPREIKLVRQLVAELTADSIEGVVAYRDRRRWVQAFSPLQLDEASEKIPRLREGGVYLISGGLGGIGLLLAEYLARTVRAKLILTGRSALPAREQWCEFSSQVLEGDISRKISKIQELEKLGAEVLTISADAASLEQMQAAIALARERFGEINGVIHAAGIVGQESFLPIEIASKADCDRQFKAKIDGLLVLKKVLPPTEPDFCLLLSSLSSVLGGIGFAAYSAANIFMDAFCEAQNRNGLGNWISVNWDGWQVGEENQINNPKDENSFAGLAELAIAPQEGIDALERILSRASLERVIVSTGNLQARIARWIKNPNSPEREVLQPRGSSSLHARPNLAATYKAPENQSQQAIAEIWQELLRIERVGIDDNFFDLGGDSLLITQLMSRVRDTFDIEVSVKQMFDRPTVAGMAESIEKMGWCYQKLQAPVNSQLQIASAPRPENIPLSFAQTRLWFLAKLEQNSSAYNELGVLQIKGSLSVDALKQSWTEIVRRHEVLRTNFPVFGGEPVQKMFSEPNFCWSVIDLQSLPVEEREAEVKQIAISEARFSFDLERGSLLRVTLLLLDSEEKGEYLLLFATHHIISDAWSAGVIVRELAALYSAFARGEDSPLPELPIQYADFAYWQRQNEPLLAEQLAYWKKQLAGAPAVLAIPSDRPRPATQTFRGARIVFKVSRQLHQKLVKLGQSQSATLFMTLLTAFQTLLFRYSSQEDIVVGSPIANRDRSEIEQLIGLFVNTLVLRTDLSGNPSFRELLDRVREVTLAAYAHPNLPFAKLVEALQPERDLSYQPLFQTMFVFQNAPMPLLELPGLTLKPLEVETGTAKFDLSLFVQEVKPGQMGTLEYSTGAAEQTDLGLIGIFEYNTDLFDASRIERMALHFQTLLEGIGANPDTPIGELSLLTLKERNKLLVDLNQTDMGYPSKYIHKLFEEQVERIPDAIAVAFEEETLTYRQLNEKANQVAHGLIELGVSSDVLVGICMERSLDMVAGLLGILKAGGAYIPLDPFYPEERLEFMLENSGASLVLTQKHLTEKLPSNGCRLICLDAAEENIAELDTKNPLPSITGEATTTENLAYVIYTSGSTGKPKGVQISHGAAVNFLTSMQQKPGLTASDVLLAVTTISFDIAALELYLPLITGASIALASREVAADGNKLSALLVSSGATVMQATPATWRMLLAAGWQGNSKLKILCGGEALTGDLAEQLIEKSASVWNMYGPTETTIWSLVYQVRETGISGSSIPIGRPINNTRVYLLNEQLQPVPVGVAGELHIGGDGLARGYLNRPELTAEKFVKFSGERVYKTGDLARYLTDGNIDCLGRIDHQVKIRGFRIELGEIETVLNQHEAVGQAVVTAREWQPGDKRLVAYLVPKAQEPTIADLRNCVALKLPEYMVPSAFVFLEAMPLTPNGKIDRRALPAPEATSRNNLEVGFVEPRTPAEEILVSIWADILDVEVGIYDNFFELGGHSLLATQAISRIHDSFTIELPLRSLFEAPTVAGLAKLIEAGGNEKHLGDRLTPEIQPVSREQELPLSFAQERLWFLDRLERGTAAYNMPGALRLSGELDLAALEQSIQEISRRHEVLRTTFEMADDWPIQKISPDPNFAWSVVDLQSLPPGAQDAEVKRMALDEAQTPFNLEKGPLLRVTLLILESGEQGECVLLFTMHHIISDAWSAGVIVRELAALYPAFVWGESSHLPELAIQYADFAHWQRQNETLLAEQLAYWQKQLAGAPPVVTLPTDRPRPEVQSFRGASTTFKLSWDLQQNIQKLCRSESVTLFMTLLAAFGTILYCYSSSENIVIGSPIANRNSSEAENLIGLFINTLVLRNDLSGNPSFRELLKRSRALALEAYANQDLPFEKLVEELKPERSQSYNPIFQVWFVLQNAPMPPLELPGLTLTPLELDSGWVRHDLRLELSESSDGLNGSFEYKTDLFDAPTIASMAHNYETILERVTAEPDIRLDEIAEIIAAANQERQSIRERELEATMRRKFQRHKRKAIQM